MTADRSAFREPPAAPSGADSERSAGSIAAFVSPHGFGHAARTSAVLQALHRLRPTLRIDLFTTVPEWFFAQSLTAPYRYHELLTDVGLVQRTTLEEDPTATAEALDRVFPPSRQQLERWAGRLVDLSCRVVLADISPLGLAVARTAGIPSVLMENFTWDWIYRPYLEQAPELGRHLEWLAETYAAAGLHIQTEPSCRPASSAVRVPPVSRAPRTPAQEVRRALAIAEDARIVLVSMGGVRWDFSSLPKTPAGALSTVYVVPGGSDRYELRDGVVLLPHRSDHYHPDLVSSADVVVGKLGYSTVAEAYWGGAGFAYVRRPRFAESAVLERFVVGNLAAVEISREAFAEGSWQSALDLAPVDRFAGRSGPNGAEVVAERLARQLGPSTG